MFPFLIVMSFPHSWASDQTLRFETLEEADDYAAEMRRKRTAPRGHEERCDIKIYELIKEVE